MKRAFQRIFHKLISFPFVYWLLHRYPYPKAMIQMSTHETLSVLVARNKLTRALGLSYRKDISSYQGMLFCFGQETVHNFHMKGMRFPLDIIWLDRHYKIIYISYNILPGRDFINVAFPSQYVIEMPAMQASQRGLKLGSALSITYV